MRLLNILVIGALVLAASFVYKIKFDSTLQAERVAALRGEIRRERDAIALLRAEWAKLETPARIEALAKRYLALRPVEPSQFDNFDRLPERPAPVKTADDPLSAFIKQQDQMATGSIPPSAPPREAQ
jgi:hypothetical protein